MFRKLNNLFLFSFMVLFMTSCLARSKPYYDLVTSYDPSAPPEWKLGWQHGCESGLSSFGNNYFKTMYKFKQDVTMVNNEYYFKGWNDSYNYCRSVVNRGLAGDQRINQEAPAVFSSDNIDIVPSGKRDDDPAIKSGIFTGTSHVGFMGSTFEAFAPGSAGSDEAWGASVDHCDWLNRCGKDKPSDPMDVLMGHSDPN